MRTSNTPHGDDTAARRLSQIRQRQVPNNEIPVSVAVDLVLVDTDDVAAFISGVRVYSTGVELAVVASARRHPSAADEFPVGSLLAGPRRRDGLILGVEFADGRVGASLGGAPPRVSTGGGVHLWSGGGGGGPLHATQNYFLSPVPPAGPLRFVVAWPAFEVDERHVDVDATAWADAARRVRHLWEPVDEAPVAAPTPGPTPRGGWFEANEARFAEE